MTHKGATRGVSLHASVFALMHWRMLLYTYVNLDNWIRLPTSTSNWRDSCGRRENRPEHSEEPSCGRARACVQLRSL